MGKYGDKINILAFPCNQFGHQTNEDNTEFLNTIKYVRPGGGFEIDPSITVFEKTDVNGADADALILPRGKFGGTTVTLWSPVSRSDIAWNFEKFLLDADGKLVNRYHRYYLIGDIAKEIDTLL